MKQIDADISLLILLRKRIEMLLTLFWKGLCGGLLLIFDLPICSFVRKITDSERSNIMETLSAGDILLTSDRLFPAWQLAVGIMGSPGYSHAAIYEGNNHVIEATTFHPSGNGVAHTDVKKFLSGRKKICVVRPQYHSEYNKKVMFTYLKQQLGKPYDYGFHDNNNNAMYCSKLVAKAMNVAGLPVNAKRFLCRNIFFPDVFTQTTEMNIVYRKKETKWKKTVELFTLFGIHTTVYAKPCYMYDFIRRHFYDINSSRMATILAIFMTTMIDRNSPLRFNPFGNLHPTFSRVWRAYPVNPLNKKIKV